MKTIKELRNRKGVSPVIATVILVAITITVAVAVAYWMSGIAGQYTQFEKIEIQSAICTYEDEGTTGEEFWKIEITLKNSGTKTATLTMVFVNEVMAIYPESTYIAGTHLLEANVSTDHTLTIDSGASAVVTVGISNWEGNYYVKLTAGTTINIKIHSAAGMDYIRLVQLT